MLALFLVGFSTSSSCWLVAGWRLWHASASSGGDPAAAEAAAAAAAWLCAAGLAVDYATPFVILLCPPRLPGGGGDGAVAPPVMAPPHGEHIAKRSVGARSLARSPSPPRRSIAPAVASRRRTHAHARDDRPPRLNLHLSRGRGGGLGNVLFGEVGDRPLLCFGDRPLLGFSVEHVPRREGSGSPRGLVFAGAP